VNRRMLLFWIFLLGAISGWLWFNRLALFELKLMTSLKGVWVSVLLYLGSHVLRVFRLILLTLDQRGKIFHVSLAHVMTSFPGIILPFKTGEILRVMAFWYVFDGEAKSLAIWLVERFGDVCIIMAFIVALYFFDVSVPNEMQTSLVLFVILGGGGGLPFLPFQGFSFIYNSILY